MHVMVLITHVQADMGPQWSVSVKQ